MITIKFNYTADDYVRANKSLRRRLTWWRNTAFTAGIFLPLLALFGKAAFLNLAWLAPIIAIWLVSLIALPMFENWNIRRQSKSTPSAEGLLTYTFSDESLRMVGSLEQYESKWDALIKATETEDDFYFYSSKSFARFLPKRAFTSELEQSQLSSL